MPFESPSSQPFVLLGDKEYKNCTQSVCPSCLLERKAFLSFSVIIFHAGFFCNKKKYTQLDSDFYSFFILAPEHWKKWWKKLVLVNKKFLKMHKNENRSKSM